MMSCSAALRGLGSCLEKTPPQAQETYLTGVCVAKAAARRVQAPHAREEAMLGSGGFVAQRSRQKQWAHDDTICQSLLGFSKGVER